MARRRVKNGEKSPWGQCLSRPVPNGRRRSDFWLVPENFCVFLPNQKAERRRPFGTGLVRHCPQGLFSPFFTFLRAIFFCPFRLSLAPTICPSVSEDVRRVTFEKFWNITSVIYAKCHVQIMLLLFAYTTTRKQVVISTCWYFKLSWNTTVLSQSNCINFSCKYNVVKTTRSLRAAWNSRNTLYSLRKGFQVVYLFECMICQGVEIQRYHTDKGKKFPLNGGCFRKWISTYNFSCYRIESRTTCCTNKNSHDLRGCIEKAYVVVTYGG